MNGLHKFIGGVGASGENTRNSGRRNIQFGSKVLLTETKVLHDLSYSVLHFTSLFEKSNEKIITTEKTIKGSANNTSFYELLHHH